MRFYFAHPISDYDTYFETWALEHALNILSSIYAGQSSEMENPNQPHHQEGYASKSMSYFYEDVLPKCEGCVFVSFPGKHIGLGVAGEVRWFLNRGLPVYEMSVETGNLLVVGSDATIEGRILTREETRGATKVLSALPNGGRIKKGD